MAKAHLVLFATIVISFMVNNAKTEVSSTEEKVPFKDVDLDSELITKNSMTRQFCSQNKPCSSGYACLGVFFGAGFCIPVAPLPPTSAPSTTSPCAMSGKACRDDKDCCSKKCVNSQKPTVDNSTVNNPTVNNSTVINICV